MRTRFINCDLCQTEGRILRNSGGPDDVDYGLCPACLGTREVEVDCERVTLADLESGDWGPDGAWGDRH